MLSLYVMSIKIILFVFIKKLNFEEPMIIYTTTNNRIILQYLRNNEIYSFINSITTKGDVLDIGYNIRDNFIIWTTVELRNGQTNISLYLKNISIGFDQNNTIDAKPIVLSIVKQKYRFTFDWIHNLLYKYFCFSY